MNVTQQTQLRSFGIVTLSLTALFGLAMPHALGQDVATRGVAAARGSSQLGSVLRSTIGGRGFRGSGGGASMAAGGSGIGYSTRSSAAMLGNRRLSNSRLYMEDTEQIRRHGGQTLISYFGRSPSVFWFAPPTYTGRGGYAPPITPYFPTMSTQMLVSATPMLALERSYHHRALLPLEGGAIRDEMTNISLANAYPIPDGTELRKPTSEVTLRSHSQVMREKILATRDKYVAMGWEELRNGKYMKSKDAFYHAGMMDSDAIEPRVGRLLCVAAEMEFNAAGVDACLATLVKNHEGEAFALSYSFAEVFQDRSIGEKILANCAAVVNAQPDSDSKLALQCYMLWLDGHRRAALTLADRLHERFRGSIFASFAQDMRRQMETEQVEQDDSTAPLS